ncbi:MAG: molybdenum cofactor guanylyltransferase [Bacteroidetes bacterium]|nr:MAG: molybdenum cofactor guanylyltransferase [Bacteroidota bacterium]
MEISAYILAGGKSSRFGSDKAQHVVDGDTMLDRIYRAIAAAGFNAIYVIGRSEFPDLDPKSCIKDKVSEKGPLGGIYTALSHTTSDRVFVISCDLPYVSSDLIQSFVDKGKMLQHVIVSVEGRLQPLFGIFHKDGARKLEELIELNELKVMRFIESLDAEIIDASTLKGYTKTSLTNVNTQQDLLI